MNVSRGRALPVSFAILRNFMAKCSGHVSKYWVKTDGSRGVLTHQLEDGMRSEYVVRRPGSLVLSQAWWATKEKPKRFECYVLVHKERPEKTLIRFSDGHLNPWHTCRRLRRYCCRAIDLFIQTVCTWEWCSCDGTIWKHILIFMYYFYYYLGRYFVEATCDTCSTVSEITIQWCLLRTKVIRCEPTDQSTWRNTIYTSNDFVSATAWKNGGLVPVLAAETKYYTLLHEGNWIDCTISIPAYDKKNAITISDQSLGVSRTPFNVLAFALDGQSVNAYAIRECVVQDGISLTSDEC